MKLRNLITILTAPILALAALDSAIASGSTGTIHEARVISANPVYRTVTINTPTEQCWQEEVYVPKKQYHSHTAEIFGAVIGAGVGSLVGSGRGQDAAMVAGAVLGGSIGRDQANRKRQDTAEVQYEQNCRIVDDYRTEERLDSYDVTYQYNGDIYTARTSHDPGSTIPVRVTVVPIE